MSNFSRQMEERKDRKENDKTRREKLAGFFYDLAKLCFEGLVVGSLISYSNDGVNMYEITKTVFGIASTMVLSKIANEILKV